jgi:hypothetical protein
VTRAAISVVAAMGVATSWLAAACGPRPAPGSVTAVDAIVHVNSNVRDAQLFIDDRLIASLDALRGGVALDPGVHRLELRRDHYFSSYLELRLARAERRTVTLDMFAILP